MEGEKKYQEERKLIFHILEEHKDMIKEMSNKQQKLNDEQLALKVKVFFITSIGGLVGGSIVATLMRFLVDG